MRPSGAIWAANVVGEVWVDSVVEHEASTVVVDGRVLDCLGTGHVMTWGYDRPHIPPSLFLLTIF